MGRTKSEFVVLAKMKGGDVTDLKYVYIAGGLHSTEEARAWLRKNGTADGIYYIVAFRAGPLAVQIENIPRRKLIAGVLPPEPVDGPDPRD